MRKLTDAAYRPYVIRMGRQPAPMSTNYARAISLGNTWVAEQESELVGLIVLEPARDHLLLENVAVAPETQGTGVGSQLLQVAEDCARAQGLEEVRLYTNDAMTENLKYYPRRGYRETHRSVQDGYSRVFFAKVVDGQHHQVTVR